MSPFKAKKLGFLAAGITVALLVAQGCSSSGDDSQASPTAGAAGAHAGSTGKSGAGNSAGATNNNGGSGNTGNDNAGAGGVDTNPNPGAEAGAAGEAGAPSVNQSCVGADGCYSCTPTNTTQFLNACVAGGCPAHFDNSTLTQLKLVGTL